MTVCQMRMSSPEQVANSCDDADGKATSRTASAGAVMIGSCVNSIKLNLRSGKRKVYEKTAQTVLNRFQPSVPAVFELFSVS